MSTNLKRAIGRSVQAARRNAGLTQEELAEKISRTPEAVSNIERGVSLPTIDTLDRIASAVAVPLGHFFPDADGGRSRKRADLEAKLKLLVRGLSDRDTEIVLGLVEVMKSGGARR